uniref:GRIP domain-containing protein n=1 Tax=Gongylonema pulchrum TaxID=637853 RepID=A0A183ERE5_9BILA
LSHAEEETRAHVELELASTRIALDELRLEHRRVTQENEELRRISTLSAENEQLRNEINVLQGTLASGLNGASPSSQCSSAPPIKLNSDVIAEQLQGGFFDFLRSPGMKFEKFRYVVYMLTDLHCTA